MDESEQVLMQLHCGPRRLCKEVGGNNSDQTGKSLSTSMPHSSNGL